MEGDRESTLLPTLLPSQEASISQGTLHWRNHQRLPAPHHVPRIQPALSELDAALAVPGRLSPTQRHTVIKGQHCLICFPLHASLPPCPAPCPAHPSCLQGVGVFRSLKEARISCAATEIIVCLSTPWLGARPMLGLCLSAHPLRRVVAATVMCIGTCCAFAAPPLLSSTQLPAWVASGCLESQSVAAHAGNARQLVQTLICK